MEANRAGLDWASGFGGASSGVPLAARGPPYFRAGFNISPDFFLINLAEYGDGTDVNGPVDVVELRGMIPVKSSLSPVSRRLRRMGRLLDGMTAGGEPDVELESVLGV